MTVWLHSCSEETAASWSAPAGHYGAPGRYGLIHLDGHTDFRHPGNSSQCANLAGEHLAAAVGLHWPAIADIDGLGPYFQPEDTVHAGCRDDDCWTRPPPCWVPSCIEADLDGYWIHLDVDILDPTVMPAVDSPDPGGLNPAELTGLLAALAPGAVGAQVRSSTQTSTPTAATLGFAEQAALEAPEKRQVCHGVLAPGSAARWS